MKGYNGSRVRYILYGAAIFEADLLEEFRSQQESLSHSKLSDSVARHQAALAWLFESVRKSEANIIAMFRCGGPSAPVSRLADFVSLYFIVWRRGSPHCFHPLFFTLVIARAKA
jgi:hypothetical protein